MSSLQEILSKLLKLKQQTGEANDSTSLEKVAEKVRKIKPKLLEFSSNQQLTKIISKIERLIREKGKTFKPKMVTPITKITKLDKTKPDIGQRTLKYSKSAHTIKLDDHLSPDTTNSKPGNRLSKTISELRKQLQQIKYLQGETHNSKLAKKGNNYKKQPSNVLCSDEQSECREKTSILESRAQSQFYNKQHSKQSTRKDRSLKSHSPKLYGGGDLESSQEKTAYNAKPKSLLHAEKQRLRNQVIFLEEKLAFSLTLIDNLTKKVSALEKSSLTFTSARSPMAKRYDLKEEEIVSHYKQQINSKNFILHHLQSKLSYFQSMNQQLKNRVLGQQRRSEDYIQNLKVEIKNLKKVVEKYKIANQKLNSQIEDLQNKNGGLITEVEKLLIKLSEQSRQKQKAKKAIISSAALKAEQLQRSISHLSTQTAYITKLQTKLQHEQQQTQLYKHQNQNLLSRLAQLQSESKKYRQERDKIEDQFSKMSEQPKQLRNQLKASQQAKDVLAEQLLETREKLQEQLRMSNQQEYENDIRTKNKLGKLREIKGLLSELK